MLLKELIKINESYLAKPFTKEEAKEVFDYLVNNGDLSDGAKYKLYDMLEDKMSYGAKKARDSSPEEFYADYFGDMKDEEIQDWIDENTGAH